MGLEKLASRILSASGGSHVVNYCYHIMLEVRHWEQEEIMDTHVRLRVLLSDPQNIWMACTSSFNMAFPEPDPPVYVVSGWEVPTDPEDLRLISKRLSSFMDQYGRFDSFSHGESSTSVTIMAIDDCFGWSEAQPTC